MILTIAAREWRSLFLSPLAWTLLAVAQGLLAWIFLLLVQDFQVLQGRLAGLDNAPGVTDLVAAPLFRAAAWCLLLITPLLTMRLFAEEHRAGTLETLLAAPVTETQVVLAKFAAAYAAFLLLWLPTLAYAAILRQCGANLPPLDWGPVAAAYLGTALIGAFFVALGLLGSLLTRHQAVAAVASLAATGLALSGGRLPFYAHTAPFRDFAAAISATRHAADFAAGIVDTRTVVWYVGGTALLLFTAIRILEARRLR